VPADSQNNQEVIDHLSAFKLYSLINITRKINSLMELDTLLELIMDSAKTLLNAEGGSLMLLNQERRVLTFSVVRGDGGDDLKEVEIPLGCGIAGLVMKTGEPLIINDAQNDPRVFKAADQKTSIITRNIVCVPLRSGRKIIGVLEAVNSLDRAKFTNDDLLILMALSEQAAVSIINRKLYDRLKTRVAELSSLYEISQLATSKKHQKDLLKYSLNIVARVMGCNHCSILLYDPNEEMLKVAAAIGIDPETSETIKVSMENEISGRAFRTVRFIFSEDVDRDPRFGKNKKFRYTSKSFVTVPMQTKEKVIGVLNATDKQNGKSFNIFDVRLLQTIANQISEVYENSRLYLQEKEKLNIEKELEVTRRLQQAIIPKRFPVLPDISMYATNLPAKEVGGDFYDYFIPQQDGNKFSALIADVSGKSISAALFMAICRSTIRAQAFDQKRTPSEILRISNDLIIRDSDSAMFVTSWFLSYDRGGRVLTYSNAGHNPPIIIRAADGSMERLCTKGKPLGVLEGETYTDNQISISQGDTLILFTDGIVEANNANNDEFGEERFVETLQGAPSATPKEIADRITRAVSEFAGDAPQFDDMTLFIIQFT